jgi:hypothetical protein
MKVKAESKKSGQIKRAARKMRRILRLQVRDKGYFESGQCQEVVMNDQGPFGGTN